MARPTDKGLISKSKLTAIADQIRRLFGVTNKFTMDRCAQELGSIVLRNNDDLALYIGEGVHVNVPSGYYRTSADYTMKDLLPPVPTITKELAAGFGMKVTARCTSTEAGYLRDGRTGNSATTYIGANDFASGDLRITQNGTYNTIQDVGKFYKTVTVNVPQPIEWDTWVFKDDISGAMAFQEISLYFYAPMLLPDERPVFGIEIYYYDNGSTDSAYMDYYIEDAVTPTTVYTYADYGSTNTWVSNTYKTLKIPSYVRLFESAPPTSTGSPPYMYKRFCEFLNGAATRQT